MHSCGFDSIPSDLGVLLLHEAVTADGSGQLEDTTLVVRALKGGASGGTVASLKGSVDDARSDSTLARLLEDPYALSPDRDAEPRLGAERDLRGVAARSRARAVGWPVHHGIDKHARRAAQQRAAGLGLRTSVSLPRGHGLWLWAARCACRPARCRRGVGALVAGLSIGPTRAVLDRVLPSPGEGPSEKQREGGFFRIEIHARTSSGARYVCRVAAEGDPGYKATSVMFGESALCLALDDGHAARAGMLTPATAMGDALVQRLRLAGQTFEVQRMA